MIKLALIVFAAIVAASVVSCMKKEGGKVPMQMAVTLAAVDKDGNDLFDSTYVNAIDIAALTVVKSDVDYKVSHTIYGRDILKSASLSPYDKRNIIPIQIGDITKECGTIPVAWVGGMDDVSEGISLIKWDDGIVDTLYAKIVRRDNSPDDHKQLYVNRKLVWDNKKGEVKVERFIYIRRFE